MRRVRAFRVLARAIDRRVWAKLYGLPHPVRLYVLRNASYLLNRRSPEPHVAALVLAILRTRPVACFWDVGANIGYYSWLAASASPATKVLAIEPDSTNLAILRESRTYAPRVDVLDVAVSMVDGRATFLPDDVSGATGTLESAPDTFNLRNYGAKSRPIGVAPEASIPSPSSRVPGFSEDRCRRPRVPGHRWCHTTDRTPASHRHRGVRSAVACAGAAALGEISASRRRFADGGAARRWQLPGDRR